MDTTQISLFPSTVYVKIKKRISIRFIYLSAKKKYIYINKLVMLTAIAVQEQINATHAYLTPIVNLTILVIAHSMVSMIVEQ